MTHVIGIDLGTTYSTVAYVKEDGQADLIPNLDGDLLTPSVIDFSTNPPVVGIQAKESQSQGGADTAAYFKRAMHIPAYQLEYHGMTYGAAEMSGLVLKYLKESAEAFLKSPVTDAVVTVPAYFMDAQREQTLKAARLAGFNVLRLINEPTAAILAFRGAPGKYLVYDLGGGTFDVTLAKVDELQIEVLAIDGDHELGGKDWDDRLVIWAADQFLENTGEDLYETEMSEILVQAEKVKLALSQRLEATFKVVGRNATRSYAITRDIFENLTSTLVERTLVRAEHVLSTSSVGWQDLAGVLLVGGSTRIPMIRKAIEQRLGRSPITGIHPDHAVAIGAALEASRLDEEKTKSKLNLSAQQVKSGRFGLLPKLHDITAHSLGIVAASAEDPGRFVNSIILEKGCPVPARFTKRYTFSVRDPKADRLEVFVTQGESTDLFNGGLSFLELRAVTGFLSMGTHQVEVTLAYDADAVVRVNAHIGGDPLIVTPQPLPADIPERFRAGISGARQPLTVYLIFDVSGSMRGAPLREAKAAANEFIRVLQPDETTQIGLMTVANEARVIRKPTGDAAALTAAVDSIVIGYGAGNQGEPFSLLIEEFQAVHTQKYAVLMADGRWLNPQRAVSNARHAHREGIEIISVGFGDQNIPFLDEVASAGRDAIFAAHGQLVSTYNSIAQELKLFQIAGR